MSNGIIIKNSQEIVNHFNNLRDHIYGHIRSRPTWSPSKYQLSYSDTGRECKLKTKFIHQRPRSVGLRPGGGRPDSAYILGSHH